MCVCVAEKKNSSSEEPVAGEEYGPTDCCQNSNFPDTRSGKGWLAARRANVTAFAASAVSVYHLDIVRSIHANLVVGFAFIASRKEHEECRALTTASRFRDLLRSSVGLDGLGALRGTPT